jgi:hypothetical protein
VSGSRPTIPAALYLLTLVAVAACADPAPRGVPVEQEPRHHLVSDEPFAQVLNVQILGGDTTLYHTHARPIAYVCIGGSEVAAQAAGEDWGAPGTACSTGSSFSNPEYSGSPLTHRVTNTGVDVFRLLAVQNLREGGSPAEVGPAVGIRLVDNEWFRVSTVEVDSRGAEDPYARAFPPHRHDVPKLVVLVGNTGISSVGADNRENIVMEPGAWTWVEAAATHSLVSIEGTVSRVVEVEVR